MPGVESIGFAIDCIKLLAKGYSFQATTFTYSTNHNGLFLFEPIRNSGNRVSYKRRNQNV